jgi:hypothetical protein
MGSQRECTRILGLDGFRVERLEWGAAGLRAHLRIWIERCGIRRQEFFRAGAVMRGLRQIPRSAACEHRARRANMGASSEGSIHL